MRNETAPDGSAPSPVTTTKPSRKRRATAPRAPRVLDPGVQAIKAEAAAKIRDYHKSQASARVLKNIVEKQLPRLVDAEREKLIQTLNGNLK